MMILGPWISYLVADGLELSGIVAILTHGVFLNIYAAPNISKGSRRVLSIAYETIAYSSETLVFIFLGIGVFAFDHPTDKLGAGSVILAVVNFNIARFLNIMVTSFLVNKTRGSTSVVSKEKKFVMWIAGLRGAMAYALAMQSIDDYGESGKLMLSITLIYSIITILGVGSILNPILIKCNVTGGAAAAVADNVPQAQEASNESEGKRRCCQGFKGFINHFD
jgi:sodium/hydrogen exchanger 8